MLAKLWGQSYIDVTMLRQAARVTNHHDLRQQSRELQRRNILETASRMLSEQGSQALTVRAVAEQLGCSTSVIYTMFGDKNGLAEALYLEGFDRLASAFASISNDLDPFAYLLELGIQYRRVALEHPHFYGLMFGQALPDFTPSADTILKANQTFETMVNAVQRCIDAGVFQSLDARACAGALWVVSHGAVSLEQAKHFSPKEGHNLFGFACQSIVGNWLIEKPAAPKIVLPKTSPQRKATKTKS